jgi:hypothetical protein
METDLSLNLELEVLIKVEFGPKIGRFSFLKIFPKLGIRKSSVYKKKFQTLNPIVINGNLMMIYLHFQIPFVDMRMMMIMVHMHFQMPFEKQNILIC